MRLLKLAIVFGAFVAWSNLSDSLSPPRSIQAADPQISFTKDVKPILAQNCVGCHNARKKKAGGDLQTSYDTVSRSLKSGNASNSRLYKSLIGRGAKQMPPKKHLNDNDITTIKTWIDAGAKNN